LFVQKKQQVEERLNSKAAEMSQADYNQLTDALSDAVRLLRKYDILKRP